ncbi:MAG: hypothetical protein WBD99_13315 [Thermodesulfobacteriota bacterium]
MIELYDHPLSGNCYKVRLLLSHLGVPYERITVDIFKSENKTEEKEATENTEELERK